MVVRTRATLGQGDWEMRTWAKVWRDRTEGAEVEADGLVHMFGVGAYAEARLRQRNDTTNEGTAHWSRVALAINRRTKKGVGLDTATRMAAHADFSHATQASNLRRRDHPHLSVLDQVDELVHILSRR